MWKVCQKIIINPRPWGRKRLRNEIGMTRHSRQNANTSSRDFFPSVHPWLDLARGRITGWAQKKLVFFPAYTRDLKNYAVESRVCAHIIFFWLFPNHDVRWSKKAFHVSEIFQITKVLQNCTKWTSWFEQNLSSQKVTFLKQITIDIWIFGGFAATRRLMLFTFRINYIPNLIMQSIFSAKCK